MSVFDEMRRRETSGSREPQDLYETTRIREGDEKFHVTEVKALFWLVVGCQFYYFFKQSSCLGCKGSESTSTALYLENCSKHQIFLKISFLKTKLFIEKSPLKLNRGT